MSNATTLRVTSTARNGTTNVVFTTNLTVSAAPDAIQFYATNMSASDNRQPYFNNLQISQGDATPPVVTLSANQRLIAIPVGGTYTADAGATATDDVSGNVTSSITNNASTAINLSAAGTYTVTYTARDAANNAGTATQTVVVHPVGTFASQYTSMAAPGSYAFSGAWTNNGSNNTAMTKTANFQWGLSRHMTNRGSFILKFVANGDWGLQWGSSSTAGTALLNGGDVGFQVPITGIYNISFNENTLAYSVARANTNGLTYDQWAGLYGLAAGSGADNPDYENGNGDFLTNQQEYEANTDPLNKDTDGDGLFDDEEVTGQYAIHSYFNGSFLNPLSSDTDGDGLPDNWELTYQLDPTLATGANGASGDPDADGISNLLEYQANSNPRAAGTGFSKISTSIHLTGDFTTPAWSENPGTKALDLVPVANFTWRGIFYWASTNAPANKNFKLISDRTWAKQWGTNATTSPDTAVRKDLQAGGITTDPAALVATAISGQGYYVVELNEATGAYSFTSLASTDADRDDLPDAWEAFYGAQLVDPTTDLSPTADSNGDGQSNLAEFQNGGNPSLDLVPPTLALASGVPILTWVALDGAAPTIGAADAVVTDDVSTGLTATVVVRKMTGASPGVVSFNSAETSRWRIDYSAQDAAGNTNTLSRTILVGDEPPGWRAMNWPPTMTLNTLGSGDVFGQIFVNDATPAAGAAPAIQAWVGVSSANTDPATWGSSAWTAATFHSQQFANDEYKGTISGAGLTPGTPYYYAYRWQIGSGAYTYGGIKADGTGAGPWDGTNNVNGVLTVQAARQVTFAVNMNVQIFKGAFDPATNGVELRADFNGFSGGASVLTREGTTTVYSGTFPVGGAEGSTNKFKFFSTGTNAVGFEAGADREMVLAANAVALNTGTNFFSGISESRKITFRVDMSTQIAKGNFNVSSNTVSVAGSFNGWSAVPLSAQGNGIYAAQVTIDGSLAGVDYKFVNGSTYESSVSNRPLSGVLPNLQASTLDVVLFNNDDGIGPVITLTGASTINLNLGDSYVEQGATATDVIDGSVTVTPSGTVDTTTAGTYTITYNASDAAGNTATPVTRTVVVAAASGYATAYVGKNPDAIAPNGWTYLVNYAFGGSDNTAPILPALDNSDPTKLQLVYVVRTDDPTALARLTFVGQVSGDLSAWGTSGITVSNGSSAGLPPNHARKVVSVDRGSDSRKFLRLRVNQTAATP